ncbi:MAG: 82, Jasper 82 [Thermomicrobiales bacterium]|jgi:DNA (cytosine-5)-methyltransferase 1|nr:82, Jasper 82 [Thermomicrobiales bacterium]
MSRPRLLDLFCGAGGAAMGYHEAGFDVTGVDIRSQPRYPFDFIQADALEYVAAHGHEYDVIHASPPCQAHVKGLGSVNRALGRGSFHVDLIGTTRDALMRTGKLWVIENVEGAPLLHGITLCGSSFGLKVRRHRRFECSLLLFGLPCAHHLQQEKRYWTSWRPNGEHRMASVVQVYGAGAHKHLWPEAMGIDWMTWQELTQAIPPAYTRYIGGHLMTTLINQRAA